MSTEQEMVDEEKRQMMIECGYALSEEWLKNAVDTATNNQEMFNHLFVLHVASVTLLAQEVLNAHIQAGKDIEEYTNNIIKELKQEIEHRLSSGKARVVRIGGELEENARQELKESLH